MNPSTSIRDGKKLLRILLIPMRQLSGLHGNCLWNLATEGFLLDRLQMLAGLRNLLYTTILKINNPFTLK